MNRAVVLHKLKYTSIHLAISAAILAVFLFFILTAWYPFPYFKTDGGWEGLRIVIAVDMVLGPFLTLLVFHPKKSRRALIFDAGFIFTVQFIALTWGGYTVYSQQPAIIVHWEETFYSVTMEKFQRRGIGRKELAKYGDERPPIVYGDEPETREEYLAQRKRLQKGISVQAQYELYRPLKENLDRAFKHQFNIKEAIQSNPKLKNELDIVLNKYKKTVEEFYYKLYIGRFNSTIMIFDHNGDFIQMLFNI